MKVRQLLLFALSFLFFFYAATSLAQDGDPKWTPPSSEPPKLELSFKDDFKSDSRSDYEFGGKSGAVTWEKGKLTLDQGAILQRHLNAGSWVKMEFDLVFPKLTENGETSELKIWLDLEDATDSFVSFRQKREEGKISSTIIVVDTEGEWNQDTPQELVKPLTVAGPIADGQWSIQYRHGLWSVHGPDPELQLFGFLSNDSAVVNQVVLTSNREICHLNTVSALVENRIVFPEEIRTKVAGADSLNQKAINFYNAGRIQQAIPIAKEALNTRAVLLGQFHPDYANSVNNLAVFYMIAGSNENAEKLYLEAKEIWEKILGKEHPNYANSLNALAMLFRRTGSSEKAELLYLEAIAIWEKVLGKENVHYAGSLNNLALLYSGMGSFVKAEPLFIEANAIQKKALGKEHSECAISANNLGQLYHALGAYEKAEPLYLEANAILEKESGKEHLYANSLNNLGGLYEFMGAYDKAEPLYLKSKAIRERVLGKKHPHYSQTLNNLAGLYKSQGAYEKAEPLFLEAVAILSKEDPFYATSLDNLAGLYNLMGSYEKAEPLFLEVKAIMEKGQNKEHPSYAISVNNLALFYSGIGSFVKAEQLFLEAIAIQKKVVGTEHPSYALSLNNLARLYEYTGAYEKASPLWLESLNTTRNNFDRYSVIQSDQRQREFAKSFDHRYGEFVSNSLRLADREASVFNQTMRWKGMNLVRQKEIMKLAADPDTSETFEQLRSVKTQLTMHIQKAPSADGWQRHDQLLSQEEALEKQLAQMGAKLRLKEDDLTAADFKLPPGSCLIDFRRFPWSEPDPKKPGRFIYEHHFLALVLTGTGTIKMLDLGPAVQIDNAINQWRRPIEQANQFNRLIDKVGQFSMDDAGAKLRNMIWKPLEKHLGDNQLVIVSPDSAIGRFPLFALPGKHKGTYVLDEKTIVYSVVPRLIPEMLAMAANQMDESAKSLLVGNIQYGELPRQEKKGLLAFRNQRVLGNLQFAPLDQTKLEIEGISKRFQNATLLTATDATESSFKNQISQHELLHIATHGFFRSSEKFMETPPGKSAGDFLPSTGKSEKVLMVDPNLLSGLAFTSANKGTGLTIDDSEDDGILFSAEIAMLPMEHVELAVLSACETSLGAEDAPGEGLIGIQRAFQVAGVKSTIASYWKVNDQATQMLMNKFYENLIEYGNKAKALGKNDNSTTVRIDALRDAQLWMLRGLKTEQVAQLTRGPDDETALKDIRKNKSIDPNSKTGEYISHPRYWAAFVLSGDWR